MRSALGCSNRSQPRLTTSSACPLHLRRDVTQYLQPLLEDEPVGSAAPPGLHESCTLGPLTMETGGFAPVVVRRGLAGPVRIGADTRRWTLQRSSSLTLPNSAAVSDVAFSPLAPHDVAAASGPTVAIVDPHSGTVRRTLARFRDIARSPCYKPDGRLLVAGCDNGTVQLFDLSSRSVLRTFNGHPRYVALCISSLLQAMMILRQ